MFCSVTFRWIMFDVTFLNLRPASTHRIRDKISRFCLVLWCAVLCCAVLCVMLWGALRCGMPCLLHYLSCFISHSIIMTFILTIFWATEMQLWLICLVCWLLALRTVQAQMWDDARWKWTRKLYIWTSSTRHWRFFSLSK